MDLEPLKHNILERLQEGNFDGFKGVNMSFRIPLQKELLNDILETLISTTDAMKDFESVKLKEMVLNEFTVDVNHRKLKKTIRCRIIGINYNQNSEPLLEIEFVEGIRFYEKFALDSAMALKKSWNWFRSRRKEEEEIPKDSGSWLTVSSKGLTVNIAGLLDKQNLPYLNKMVVWENLLTAENKLIIVFSIKT